MKTPLMKTVARGAVVAVAAATVLVMAEPAVAIEAPRTLAETAAVQAGPVDPAFPIDFVGVLWDLPAGHDHDDHAPGADAHGQVRFLDDGAWGEWIPLTDDGAEAEGQWASGLVPGGDADAYQVRGVAADAVRPRAVAINTTDGPLVKVGEAAGGVAHAATPCKSRADWFADESLRFDASGNEIWPAAHHPVQVTTVHHTATDNNDPDPVSTVQAIYRYHAIDRGWGDIGYQHLIDESGVVYEGRWSGTQSVSCAAGGDGSDFGHETDADGDLDGDGVTDEMVTGAHVGGSNSGNMGVALLGEFTDHKRWGGDPKAAAVDSLEAVLAELGTRHGLNPLSTVEYVNPVTLEKRVVETISGHRDWGSTECPGQRLYDQLPTIRQAVADRMASSGTGSETDTTAPTVSIVTPGEGSTVWGDQPIEISAADTSGVASVEWSIDGGAWQPATLDTSSGYWVATWKTTTVVDGSHTLSARATDGATTPNTSEPVSAAVTVANDTAPASIALQANGYKVKGVQHADLSWTSGSGTVDVVRDGAVITTTSASAYTDHIGSKGAGTYTYQVCPTGTAAGDSTCSNTATVTF